MKKIILSLSALLTIGIASAQSYPKQPDPTVTYVEYKKVVKAESEQADTESVQNSQSEENSANLQATVQPATTVSAATVSENRKNSPVRKEE